MRADRLWHLRPSDLEGLADLALTAEGRREIIGLVGTFLHSTRASSVAELDSIYSLGVQLASVWPHAHAEDEDMLAIRGTPADMAFACGFVGRAFDDVFHFVPENARAVPVAIDASALVGGSNWLKAG